MADLNEKLRKAGTEWDRDHPGFFMVPSPWSQMFEGQHEKGDNLNC